MSEKLHTSSNQGRMASILLEQFKPYLDRQKQMILESLMVQYRQGKLEHVAATSQVAALCALEDIENNLKQDIHKGERASKELIDANPPS